MKDDVAASEGSSGGGPTENAKKAGRRGGVSFLHMCGAGGSMQGEDLSDQYVPS